MGIAARAMRSGEEEREREKAERGEEEEETEMDSDQIRHAFGKDKTP